MPNIDMDSAGARRRPDHRQISGDRRLQDSRRFKAVLNGRSIQNQLRKFGEIAGHVLDRLLAGAQLLAGQKSLVTPPGTEIPRQKRVPKSQRIAAAEFP